ncbi:MAG: 2-oxo acid dehydrogenase subunit E2 [Chloroflexi bacterium]|nr:2-oxo acid dehydrogenase subunit E2 [Chloroflexota bacterium]
MADIVEMPKLGFDMAEGTLVKWVKAEKDPVEKGDVLAEIETDKATVEVESPFSGVVLKHLSEAGKIVPVGAPIAVIAAEGEEVDVDQLVGPSTEKETKDQPGEAQASESSDEDVSVVEKSEEETPSATTDDFIKASPLAKRMAEENKIRLAAIKGSGPDGRIVKRDVEKALETGKPSKPREAVKPKIVSGQDQVIEISKLRAAIGKRMLESRQTIPDFYVTYTYNAGSLMQMREDMNRELPDDERLSVNDFIIRAVALALREFPNLNASLNNNQLTLHGDINIGSAVAVENGLLTVVVRNADQKPLSTISAEMREMVARVKDGKVRNEDIEGSTFTLSNLGMFGVEDFVAIINPPEAAILAIGGALQVPVIQNNQIIIGWQMKATLSADHRITDGAEAARFMQHLAVFLEQPWRLVQ